MWQLMLKLVKFSPKNSIVIILSIVMLVTGGIYSSQQMKMEKYPDVTIPFFGVHITYPSSTPEQAMQNIGIQSLSNN
jgi:multidrug efflux pump subunit AcrB